MNEYFSALDFTIVLLKIHTQFHEFRIKSILKWYGFTVFRQFRWSYRHPILNSFSPLTFENFWEPFLSPPGVISVFYIHITLKMLFQRLFYYAMKNFKTVYKYFFINLCEQNVLTLLLWVMGQLERKIVFHKNDFNKNTM